MALSELLYSTALMGLLVIGFTFIWMAAEDKRVRNRPKTVKAIVEQRGLQFQGGPFKPEALGLNPLPYFNTTHEILLQNVCSTSRSNGIFLYCERAVFPTRKGRRSNWPFFVPIVCRVAESSGVSFTLGPESVFSKIAQSFGQEDIDLSYDQDFSNRFVLRGDDVERVKNIFNPEVTKLVTELGKEYSDFRMECANGAVICYLGNEIRNSRLGTFIDSCDRLFGLLGVC